MNKRFSTLMAAALVVGGVSAFAGFSSLDTKAIAPGDVWTSGIKNGDLITLNDADTPAGLVSIADAENGIIKTNQVSSGTLATVSLDKAFTALWKIEIIKSTSTAGWDTYSFANKATQQSLAVELKTNGKSGAYGLSTTELTLNEDGNSVWGWNKDLGLYAVEGDSTYFLTVNGGNAHLTSAKGGVGEALAAATALNGTDPVFVVTPTVVTAFTDLTPDNFNYLVGETGKLYFNNGKDVLNPSIAIKNAFTEKKLVAASAVATKGGADKDGFLLATPDSSDVKNPKVIVVDTLCYDIAGKYNHIVFDTLGTKPSYAAGVLNAYTNQDYRIDGEGDDAVVVATRPIETATFTGKYYFAQDSMVLFSGYVPSVDNTATTLPADGSVAYYKIMTTAVTGANLDGRIALKMLDTDKIVLTPAYTEDVTTNDKAKATNFILPLIQPAAFDAVDDNRTTVADDVYFITDKDGKYLTVPVYATDSVAQWVTLDQDFNVTADMPATQWVVLKNVKSSDKSAITMVNREYPKQTASVQLVNDEDGNVTVKEGTKLMNYAGTLNFTAVSADAKGDTLLGYKHFNTDSLKVLAYTFNHFNPYDDSHYIAGGSETDSVMTVKEGKTPFAIAEVEKSFGKYGYAVSKTVQDRIPGLKQMYRSSYNILVKDGSKQSGDSLFINKEDKFVTSDKAYGNKTTKFYFKENNCDGTHYYVLISMAADTTKAGVAENTKNAVLKSQVMTDVNSSVFAISAYDAPLYRTLFNADGTPAGSDTIKIFSIDTPSEFLGVESNKAFQKKGINFLGMETAKTSTGYGLIADSVWVKRGLGYIKPQYLLSIDKEVIGFVKGEKCPVCKELEEAGKPVPAVCPHDTESKAGFVRANFLINASDSVAGNKDYAWMENAAYPRLAFIDAVHMGDSLYILRGEFKGIKTADFDTTAIIAANAAAIKAKNMPYIINLAGDNHKVCTFSFRFLEPEAYQANKEDDNFLIESMPADKTKKEQQIAPVDAWWVRLQNNVIVLAKEDFKGAKDDAMSFDIASMGANDDVATDTEDINTTVVSVAAGEGQVAIKNAANKTVAISNILGQTLVNTVITSDNAIISVPAGLVVVAVDGEAAVKAIVR